MRRLGILIFMFITLLLLTSCGVETNISDKYINYIGKYNERYYFQERNSNTNYITYLDKGEFVRVKEKRETDVITVIGNKLLIKHNDDVGLLETYGLLDLDTLEYSDFDLTNSNLALVSYVDDEVIVFHSINREPTRFFIYSLKDEEVIADKAFDIKNSYRYESVYYDDNKLYLHFIYTTRNANNYDYIYDLNSDTITKVNSVMSNDMMVVGDQTLLFFRSNSQYTNNGTWITTGSSQENYFDSADFRSLQIYNNSIIENQFYNNQINILNDEFIVTNQYDINYDCYHGLVISEDELVCFQKKVYGSLIKTEKKRIIIYNFKSDEIILQSDWMQSGSQYNNIVNK